MFLFFVKRPLPGLLQDRPNDFSVLLRLDGAGRIDGNTAWPNLSTGVQQQSDLHWHKLFEVAWSQSPSDFGAPAQHSRIAARHVNQCGVKSAKFARKDS